MNTPNEWSTLAELWQQPTSLDVERLHRRVRRKGWRMRLFAMLEVLLTAFAVVQVFRLLAMPGIEWRWKLWTLTALVFVVVVQWLVLHARRGTWQAAGHEPRELLQFTARRAAAGIRLAKINAWSLLVWVIVTLLVAAPELAPDRWLHDAELKHIVALQLIVNVPIIVGSFALCAWYIRRQRRKLGVVRRLLDELEDDGSAPGPRSTTRQP